MIGLIGAIQFLTRVPVSLRSPIEHHRVVPWFPIVGALIGAAVGGVAVGLGELIPTSVVAALVVIVGLLITGAFHEDGLADVADAFGGGWTRQQRFEILKDSHHGTYGVAALCSSVVLRVVCVASIASPAAVFAGLLAAHTLGRSAAVGAMLVARPATESGLGADSTRSLRTVPTALGLGAGVALAGVVAGWWVGPMVAGAFVGTGGVVWLAARKIGGLAGDVLGAIEQVVEVLVLVIVSGLAVRHRVWWS
jgi:adenosylcobinamide-GDP ribazoletransferase